MRLPKETKTEDIEIGSHQRCHIMVTVLTLGMVPIEWWVASSRMQFPINGQVLSNVIKGFEVGDARNLAVEHVLQIPKSHRPRWMFFFGDDMLPPWDGFVKLYEIAEKQKWDCLTGLYYWKGEPPTPLTWRNDHIGRLIPNEHFAVGDVIDVDLTGLDFTLIRTDLLEKMRSEYGPPYFKTGPSKRSSLPSSVEKFTLKEGIVAHTEDVWFYGRARKLGATIGVHSGVRVSHYDVKTGCIY